MFDLKDFQEDAVSKLVSVVRRQIRALNSGARINRNVIFKSPTGSGKTIMLTEVLRRLPEDDIFGGNYYVFLWLAPMKLHAQSYIKLKTGLTDSSYTLINIDDGLTSGPLLPNTILFSNWEKLNSTAKQDMPEKGLKAGDWTNTAVRQGEQSNLQDILTETREKGGKIILIVDESHQTFYGDKSQDFVDEVVKPEIVLQASATPKEKPIVEVLYDDVVQSGLIKEEIIINNDLASNKDSDKTIIENLIAEALKKREDLAKKYESMGKHINPLLLVQLPNDKETMSTLDIKYKDYIMDKFSEFGIAPEYENMAIWLSDEKQNLDNITDLDSKVQVLLFKQAIALGWDCPRAQVMLMFRDVKSDSFKIQTLGRILRMPEAKYYEDSELNAAYVYTDLASIKIEAEASDPMRNLIKYKMSRINPVFNSNLVTLPNSVYLSRIDYGDLNSRFRPSLVKTIYETFEFNEEDSKDERHKKLDKKLEIYEEELLSPVLSDKILKNLDEYTGSVDLNKDNNTVKLAMDDDMIESVFNTILRECIKPFKNFARSRSIVYLPMKDAFRSAGISDFEMQKIFACSALNQEILRQIFARAIDRYDSQYQKEMKERRDRAGKIFDFVIPERDSFSDNSSLVATIRNIYIDYYRFDKASGIEKRFENYIDHNDKVLWWYKNGDKGDKYFAVPYSELDTTTQKTHRSAFYPDYIIRFKDDTTGIFDTKLGFTAENTHAKQKADALQSYLRSHADLCLWGGLVTEGKDKKWKIQADYLNPAIAKMDSATLPEFDYDESSWVDLNF